MQTDSNIKQIFTAAEQRGVYSSLTGGGLNSKIIKAEDFQIEKTNK